jgi:hypothetical protein
MSNKTEKREVKQVVDRKNMTGLGTIRLQTKKGLTD